MSVSLAIGFFGRTLAHEIGDARVFAVRVVFGHAASIGRKLCSYNGCRGAVIAVAPRTGAMPQF
jgi:hypothetical protein